MSDIIENQAPVAPQEAPATIGIVDLQNAVKIIDYAADQGAFKGWAVIEQVAAVRQKLNAFVEAATAAQEKQAAEAAQAEAPVDAPAASAKKVTKRKAK